MQTLAAHCYLLLVFFSLVAGCNIQGSGTKIDANFRPGYVSAETTVAPPSGDIEDPQQPDAGSSVVTPVLTTLSDRVFPGTYLDQSSALTLDVNDTANSGEAASGYVCYFDRSIDGAVDATSACSALPGTADVSNLAAQGTLLWTPDSAAFGPFEIKFIGSNSAGSDDEIVAINVRQNFSTSSLAAYWDAQFATGTSLGSNAAATAQLQDLVAAATNHGDLLNFDYVVDGWNGDGARVISSAADGPHRLTLDGVDNYVDFTSEQNALSDITIETWIRPTSATTSGAVIIGNIDNANNFGIQVRQSTNIAGRLELLMGNGGLLCESTQGLADNIWYHVAATFDGGSDTATLYINGTQECTATNGGQILEGSAFDLRFGADDAGANPWAGSIAELRVYSAALAHGIIKANFVATAPRYPDVLSTASNLALWLDAAKGVSANGGTVTAWADQSGNNNNAAASVPGQEPSFLASSVNSLPAIRFVATGSVLKIADSATLNPASITIISVFTRQAGSTNDAKLIARPFDTAESGGAPFYSWSLAARYAGSDAFAVEAHTGGGTLSTADSAATYADGSPQLLVTTYNSGTTSFAASLGGAASALNAPATAPTGAIDYAQTGQNIWIGSSPYADHVEADIAEIIIYGGVLTADEQLRVQSYLNAKYALYP